MKGTGNSKFVGLLVFLVILLATAGCAEEPESDSESDTETVTESGIETVTYWPTEGWRTSTPEQQGLDSEKLGEVLDYIQEEDVNIHSLMIIRNGYVVMDAYFYPFSEGSIHDTASVTKSFTSTLIGIAISEGYISGVEQPVLGFFSERTVENVDARKEAMTLEDLLTMRSGFECVNDPFEATLSEMRESPDWVQFTLDLPMAEEPGTRFVYCSPNSHLLSGIIRETTGMSEQDYANGSLFEPLGISNVSWPSDPQGNNHGWGDLRLTPYDMAKLGYLYLNGGIWDGKQVVPAEWVTASTQQQVSPEEGQGYGYQWWISGILPGLYEANGRGGQRIIVWPQEKIIVATTGGGFEPDELSILLLAALQSDQALPEKPEAYEQLQEKITAASNPPDPEPVPPLPEMAENISGKTYVVESNPFGIEAITLIFEGQEEALLNLSLDEEQQTLPVGLDNVYRISPGGEFGPLALKGFWKTDNEFVFYYNEVSNINNYQVNITYEDDQVTVRVEELTGTGSATFGGRVEEGENEQEAASQLNTGL
jgi:CubicO group peptidase (beta-lactamase class C family)